MLLEFCGKRERNERLPFLGSRVAEQTTVRKSANVLPLGIGDNGECCFCGNLQPVWKSVCTATGIYTGQISVELISSSSSALVRNDPGLLMASLWRQSSSLHRLGRQCCQTQARLSQDLSMPPPTTFADSEERWDLPLRKRLEADAAEWALFLHTRNCLCSLTARSCKQKINNSKSCRRRNNATLHQTGPCFAVSSESVLHKRTGLPFGLYILLMWLHIYCTMG